MRGELGAVELTLRTYGGESVKSTPLRAEAIDDDTAEAGVTG
jgi:hypothetical protein